MTKPASVPTARATAVERRTRSRRWWALGAIAVLSAVGVPCGTASGAGAAAGPGVVSIGEDLSGVIGDPVQFDPTLAHTPGVQLPWQMAVYDTLLRPTPGGGFQAELATSATIGDPETISVQLRPNVVFSDGTAFTASAVKAGIMRNRNAQQLGGLQSVLQDLASIDVTSPTALTLHLSQPVAGAFYPLLAESETLIVAPSSVASAQVNTNPVGAGPFVLRQLVPNQRIVLAKNPKYWDAKDIHINELDFTSVAAGPQQMSGLRSGLVNVTAIPIGDVPSVRSDPSYRVGSAASQTQTLWMPVCKSVAPLSSLKVRQALNYALDRQSINRAVLQGVGEPQWALWPKNSIYFPPDLTGYYAYNPKKAHQLLAQAGYPHGFSTQMVVGSGSPVMSEAATIIQAEWKAIGVNVNLVPSTNIVSDLYVRKIAPMGLQPEVRGGITSLSGPYGPGSIGNLCSYSSPVIDSYTSQLSALAPGSPKSVAIWRQAQDFVVKNALSIWVDYSPYVFASSTKVSGVQFLAQYALPVPYYWSLRAS